ncbi:MAG: hypothetical protein F4X05_00220 [Rhodothermaceae bacterium]|nr:hypothetical protein [Rhodothermaceae bacterium]MYD18056.1 hypothetical protein [Rhodothermaceae bacterium]
MKNSNIAVENVLVNDLKRSAKQWRSQGYPCDDYPLIGILLNYQVEKLGDVLTLKFLRDPQFLALEVYWYVRLVLKTPRIIDLYRNYYGDNKKAFFDALGVPLSRDALDFVEIDQIVNKIREDESFVKDKRLQALNEAVKLDYPSYILALAMGAGKTVLIGTIIATEFAMSMCYPQGIINFMKNALVFAPGTTIIESLRELSSIPYEKVLPPNLYQDFVVNLKIEYADNKKDLQTQKESIYNLIVTNTEKISLRARQRRNQAVLSFQRDEVLANLRLQKIASLPNLGIFSDEAHHTYGNTFNKLKRVRETINFINENKPIVAVVNTTGTPYYKQQMLRDVIVWYGLGDGIRDNILKDLDKGIHQYEIAEQEEQEVFKDIVEEFFGSYGDVQLPDGAKAKIAFYFKTQEHLNSSQDFIEKAMVGIGEDVSQILVNTQKSSVAEVSEFKRLNVPDNQKRVILLIAKGVEGWNCPSLFACALIKEQTSSTYVLQAATRCLRQIPGKEYSAKIFLDSANASILDKQLRDNFRTDLERLGAETKEKEIITVYIPKKPLPELVITRTVKRAVAKKTAKVEIRLIKPEVKELSPILRGTLAFDFSGPREILMPTGELKELPPEEHFLDCYSATFRIASRYHLPFMSILKKLKKLYPEGEIPQHHLDGIIEQVEEQGARYETIEEEVIEAMALIRFKDENGEDLFERDKNNSYIHRLRMQKSTCRKMRERGLLVKKSEFEDTYDLSFHYTPYNFDTAPERSFFRQILSMLNENPEDVDAFLFTGGLTDPKKTDFHFEYFGEDNRYHLYFPDFVIVKKTGEFYIVEIKAERDRGNNVVEAKAKAVERLEKVKTNKFKYQIVYTSGTSIGPRNIKSVKDWIKSGAK